ncbi:MAG: DoxX family membrane protein [Actinomycetota bacterium]
MGSLKDVRVVGGFWLLVRLFLGYEWLKGGLEKLGDPAWTGGEAGAAVTGFLKGALAKSTGEFPEVQGWYVWFIENVALPNATVFSYLVVFGQIAAGAALLVGFLTRFAALGGAIMNLAFLWAGTSSSNPQMLVLGLAIVLVGSLAGYYGLDRYVLPGLRRQTGRAGEPAGKTHLPASPTGTRD